MLQVYAVSIKGIIIDPEWLHYISEEKQQLVLGLRDPQYLAQVLVGDLLIRCLAVQHLNVSNSSLHFQYKEGGKPFLEAPYSDFHFNLAHSEEWVVCAVDKQPVGIDVQLMEPIDLNLAKNVLAPYAYRYYLSLPHEKRPDYFYDLWTLRESYLKLVGKGMTEINSAAEFHSAQVDTPDTANHQKVYYQRHNLGSDYKVATCTNQPDISAQIEIITLEQILKTLSSHT